MTTASTHYTPDVQIVEYKYYCFNIAWKTNISQKYHSIQAPALTDLQA